MKNKLTAYFASMLLLVLSSEAFGAEIEIEDVMQFLGISGWAGEFDGIGGNPVIIHQKKINGELLLDRKIPFKADHKGKLSVKVLLQIPNNENNDEFVTGKIGVKTGYENEENGGSGSIGGDANDILLRDSWIIYVLTGLGTNNFLIIWYAGEIGDYPENEEEVLQLWNKINDGMIIYLSQP